MSDYADCCLCPEIFSFRTSAFTFVLVIIDNECHNNYLIIISKEVITMGGKSIPTPPPIPDNGKTKGGVSVPTGGKNGTAGKGK